MSNRTWRWHFIEDLIKEHGWTKGAELGLWKGKTFLYILATCPDVTMIGVDMWQIQDNPDDKQIGSESYKDWDHVEYETNVRKESHKYGDRAIIYKMSTDEAAELVEDGSLDFVFIDADHTYEGVKNDIKRWRPKVKPEGWILGHDIDWNSVRQAVEEEFPDYIKGQNTCWGSQNG